MCTLDGKYFYVEQFISQLDIQLHVVIVPVIFHWCIVELTGRLFLHGVL